MGWLDELTEEMTRTAGLTEGELGVDDATAEEILDLARIASHTSGERINAPLLCYVLGIAVGRGARLDDLARIVRERA